MKRKTKTKLRPVAKKRRCPFFFCFMLGGWSGCVKHRYHLDDKTAVRTCPRMHKMSGMVRQEIAEMADIMAKQLCHHSQDHGLLV
jgi:hypothetical protein